MKNIILFACIAVASCNEYKDIPYRANTVIARGLSKDQIKKLLASSGFTSIDHDSVSIVTLPKQYKQLDWGNLIVEVYFGDSSRAYFHATYNQIVNPGALDPAGKRYYVAEYRYMRENNTEAFTLLKDLVRSFGSPVSYARFYTKDNPAPWH